MNGKTIAFRAVSVAFVGLAGFVMPWMTVISGVGAAICLAWAYALWHERNPLKGEGFFRQGVSPETVEDAMSKLDEALAKVRAGVKKNVEEKLPTKKEKEDAEEDDVS